MDELSIPPFKMGKFTTFLKTCQLPRLNKLRIPHGLNKVRTPHCLNKLRIPHCLNEVRTHHGLNKLRIPCCLNKLRVSKSHLEIWSFAAIIPLVMGMVDAVRRISSATVWAWLLPGLGGGLYAARTAAEFGPLALPWWGISLLAVACAAVGAAVARQLQGRTDLRPLLVTWAYVVYPALDPGMAAGIGFVALIGTLLANVETMGLPRRDHLARRLILPTAVFALALALYIATLAPDLLAADNAEYQLVAHHLGVAHPPGYALHTMVGKLFTLLPLNNPAWRVNLFAAVTGALTLALVARTVQRLTNSAWGGLTAALALGVAPTFWAQSTTANIRSLTALFAAWCFDALVTFGQVLRRGSGQAQRRGQAGQGALSRFALGLGLGIGHHFSLGFLLPAFGLYLLVADPSLLRQPRRWIRPGLIFVSTFVVWAYLPLRGAMGAVLAPDHLTTLDGFLEHVLARGFGGDMFAFLHAGVLPHRCAVLGDTLAFQFGAPLLVVAGLGALALLWHDRRAFLLFGVGFGLFYFLVATYRAPQTVEYLMPAYVPVGVAVGCAAGIVPRRRRWSPVGPLLAALMLLPGCARLARHYPSFAVLHRDHTARDYAEPILRHAPPDAAILSNWHWSTAFWYLQQSESLRPDVDVVYVYPHSASYADDWVACIEATPNAQPECLAADLADRPLIVTDWYNNYGLLPHRFVPFGQAYLVQREPLFAPPPDMAPLDTTLDDEVRLAGYRLSDKAPAPGGSAVVHLAWQPVAEWERAHSFFVQLLGPGGLVGQGSDVIHPAGRYHVGEVVVDRFEVAVWPTATPGDYALVAGVYVTPEGGGWQRLTTPEGQDRVALETVRVEAPAAPPVTLHPLRHRFVDGPTLVGADFDHSPGQPRRVYLHWQLPPGPGDGYAVQLTTGGEPVAEAGLPSLPGGGYLTSAHDVPVGALAATVRPADSAGQARRVGPWGLLSSDPAPLPDPSPDSRFVPLGGEMALTGVHTRHGVQTSAEERHLLGIPDGAGEILQVDLRWLSLGALTRDRVVSLQAPAWGVNHDSVPALGAIPTLKWIRGATVRDRHFLRLPQGTSGEVSLDLIVYDHFTHRPLALLDDRLARLSNMVPLGTVTHGQ
jgi:hypothetical protein